MEELTQDGAQLARTMLMAAAQLAESMARVQAQRAWMAQSRFTAQASQAQQQIAAERDAARMIFRPLTDDRYWRDAPQLDRVVQAYMAAASWAEHDPEAQAAARLIKQQAESRWGREISEARVRFEPGTAASNFASGQVRHPQSTVGTVQHLTQSLRLAGQGQQGASFSVRRPHQTAQALSRDM